jgi:uncharacterized membrane protein HdeD (DUF308 family)
MTLRVEFEEICHNWGWFLVLGIVLLVLGGVALGSVWVSTIASVVLFGWLLIAAGVFEMSAAFGSQQWSGVFLHLLAGVLNVVVGIMLVGNPLASAGALTLLVAALFLTGGLFRFMAALMVRHAAWGWAALDGLVGILCGVLIWSQWPASAFWVIGMFVGIALMVRGWAWVMFALSARHVAHEMDVFGHGHPQRAA